MGAGTFFLLLILVVVVAIIAVVFFAVRSKLSRDAEEGKLPSQGEQEHPEHLDVSAGPPHVQDPTQPPSAARD